MAEHLRVVPTIGGGQFTPTPPGGGDGMDTENRLTKLETKLDTLLPMLATKSDIEATNGKIEAAKSSTVMWIAGIGFAIVATLTSVIFFVGRSNAPTSQQAPIIIYPQQSPAAQQSNLPAPQSPPNSKRGQ